MRCDCSTPITTLSHPTTLRATPCTTPLLHPVEREAFIAATKPLKPTPDFPLFPHSSGVWAKKVAGKLHYFGLWANPQAALDHYRAWLTSRKPEKPTIVTRSGKTGKPHKDYPLYRHSSGQWAKRVRGRVRYFGTDPDAALKKWARQKDDLLAGREPEDGDGLTVGKLADLFLSSKQRVVDSGELEPRTWNDYNAICQRVLRVFGPGWQVANLRPGDFEKLRADFAKTHGPVALHSDITRARVLFHYAFKQHLIDRPVAFGDSFDKPSRDNDAVRAIMGHAESANDMSAVYNEEPVDDARLRAVTDYVRAWLFPTKSPSAATGAA